MENVDKITVAWVAMKKATKVFYEDKNGNPHETDPRAIKRQRSS